MSQGGKFSDVEIGMVPASSGGTQKYLRADGEWVVPPSGGGPHATDHQNGGTDEINVAGLSGLLADAQTPAAHSHVESDVTNLVSDLAGKAAASHTHNATDINAGTIGTARLGSGTPSGSNFLRGDQTWAAPAGGGITTLRTTANQTINAGAATFVDITGLTFAVTSGVDYSFHFYITFRSAQLTTGWKSGVNCPAGTLDFWAGSQIIANGAAGVATHTERHNVTRDDMTLLTATITNNVDLAIIIEGRYLCTANGTFAARFANELAANTDLVVQKGSWGWWF